MRVLAPFFVPLLVLGLAAQAPAAQPSVAMTPARAVAPVDAAVATSQSTVARIIAPAIVSVREAVQQVVPLPPPALFPVSPAAADLIVRWEVTSPAYYTRALQRPVWPGGASGITWGIGYDGGHQTTGVIASDWAAHGDVWRLRGTAGLVGIRARDALPRWADIVTPFALARTVFVNTSLPVWHDSTRGAYGPAFDSLPADAAGALVSNTYNRGTSMLGDRNREKRVIRDECLPRRDLRCIAAQLRASCRVWVGTPIQRGMCARREDEARLAEAAR
ncbi:hypothetical protein [Xanthomonas sacchari]|nr:hypothetical protein [Xanthomonas sacchari]UYK72523.1 hypothetical protein NG828_20440 [Xanthomonas sacchari]